MMPEYILVPKKEGALWLLGSLLIFIFQGYLMHMKPFITLLFFISWFIISAQDSTEHQIPKEILIELMDREVTDESQKGIPVGEVISDSTFTTIQGKEISFIDSKYELTVIDFWFKGCRGCAQEKYFIKQIIEKYKDDPRVRFVAITPSSKKGIEKVKKRYGDYYDNIITVGSFKNCEKLFRFKSFPRHVFVDSSGRVISNYRISIFHPVLKEEYEKRILSFISD